MAWFELVIMANFANFQSAVGAGFRFAFNPKNFAVFFIMMLVELGLILAGLLLTTTTAFMAYATSINISTIAGVAPYLIAAIIAGLIDILFTGSFVHRFKTLETVGKSVKYSLSRYITLLIVVIIVGAISTAAALALISLVYLSAQMAIVFIIIDLVVLFILAVLFMFVYQEVIIAKSSVVDTLKNSYRLFRKEWLNMIITIIISGILSIIIMIIAIIPFLFAVIRSIAGFLSLGNADISTLATLIFNNMGPLAITGLIAIAGIAITKLLSIGIVTHVYSQLKKK